MKLFHLDFLGLISPALCYKNHKIPQVSPSPPALYLPFWFSLTAEANWEASHTGRNKSPDCQSQEYLTKMKMSCKAKVEMKKLMVDILLLIILTHDGWGVVFICQQILREAVRGP